MNAMTHIRKNVFRVTQIEMASIADVAQSTISRWENGGEPTQAEMARIRLEAIRRAIPWDDRWFFEAPVEVGE